MSETLKQNRHLKERSDEGSGSYSTSDKYYIDASDNVCFLIGYQGLPFSIIVFSYLYTMFTER